MPLITPEQAAAELAVSVKHLRGLPIPYVDIGTGERTIRRYDPADLRAFVEEKRRVYGV